MPLLRGGLLCRQIERWSKLRTNFPAICRTVRAEPLNQALNFIFCTKRQPTPKALAIVLFSVRVHVRTESPCNKIADSNYSPDIVDTWVHDAEGRVIPNKDLVASSKSVSSICASLLASAGISGRVYQYLRNRFGSDLVETISKNECILAAELD